MKTAYRKKSVSTKMDEESKPPFVRSMCRHFMNGFCKFGTLKFLDIIEFIDDDRPQHYLTGDACNFAHRRSELGTDTKMYAIRCAPVLRNERVRYQACRHFMRTGMCKFGEKCVFAHGAEELSAWREQE